MTIPYNSFYGIFKSTQCECTVAMATLILHEKIVFETNFTIIVLILQVKKTVENVDLFFSEDGRSIIFGKYCLHYVQ